MGPVTTSGSWANLKNMTTYSIQSGYVLTHHVFSFTGQTEHDDAQRKHGAQWCNHPAASCSTAKNSSWEYIDNASE